MTSAHSTRTPGAVPEPDARRLREFDRARRNSSRVRLLKVVLPSLAVLAVAAGAGYTWFRSVAPVQIGLVDSAIEDGRLVMRNPKLNGFTADNRAYAVTAERAVQDLATPQVIELQNIAASVPFGDGVEASIDAPKGVFDNDANTLDLDGAFQVRTTDGMVANLQSAAIDLDAKTLTTGLPVDILRNGSRIVAESMSIANGGKTLVFERGVRLTLQPGSFGARKPAADTAAQ